MKLKPGVKVHSGKETFEGYIPDEKALKLGIKKPDKKPVYKEYDK